MATPPKTLLDVLKTNYLDTKDTNKLLPVIINIMLFILYVMCFVSLYKPYLELIGYGLFFALHIIMSFGMIKNIMVITPPLELFAFLNPLGSPFNLLNQIPVYSSILIGLALLFISLILLLIVFTKLQAKHTSTNLPSLPGYISAGNGESISGYTYKMKGQPGATNGAGYYLNTGSGTDFYFNDKVTKEYINDFKILAITTTVLLWAQYLLYTNYVLFNTIFALIGDKRGIIIWGLILLFGLVIIILSSICVSLMNKLTARTKYSQDPVVAAATSNNSGKSAETSVEPTTVYGQIREMIKTVTGL